LTTRHKGISRDVLKHNQTSTSNFSNGRFGQEKKGFHDTFSRNTFVTINFRDQGDSSYIPKVEDLPEHYLKKSSEKQLSF